MRSENLTPLCRSDPTIERTRPVAATLQIPNNLLRLYSTYNPTHARDKSPVAERFLRVGKSKQNRPGSLQPSRRFMTRGDRSDNASPHEHT